MIDNNSNTGTLEKRRGEGKKVREREMRLEIDSRVVDIVP